MAQDAQGHSLTGANADTASHVDLAVRAFTLNYGDANAHLTAALEVSPECAMAGLLRCWLLALSNDPAQIAKIGGLLAELPEAAMNERERSHLAALRLAASGRWASAVAALDRHLMTYPHDLTAHQCALRLDGYLGRFHRTAGRSARALPFWSKDQPGHSILKSFYGFGLEELGEYGRAEEIGRAAADVEPYGYWSHHAVSHVLEMTGRPDEGVAWMEQRLPFWSDAQCNNRVHIWWHKALFHIELGRSDEALRLYDDEILTAMRPVGTQLCNATALLWRLEMLGCEAGGRWQHQHTLWQKQANGKTSPFNEIHAAIAALRAGERPAFEALQATMRQSAETGSELAATYGGVAVPIVEAMAKFVDGKYGDAVDHLLAVRADLWRMGGSIAQRDVIEWTLAEAAVRASMPGVARSLANERLAARPQSVVNRDILKHAEALGA
ncbi:MAG: tetratricopeptide repeat protein [Hyphomicrobiaceae bacterium]